MNSDLSMTRATKTAYLSKLLAVAYNKMTKTMETIVMQSTIRELVSVWHKERSTTALIISGLTTGRPSQEEVAGTQEYVQAKLPGISLTGESSSSSAVIHKRQTFRPKKCLPEVPVLRPNPFAMM